MAAFLSTMVAEKGAMPFPLALAFLIAGFSLPLIASFRSWQSWREWKVKSARQQRSPFKLSPAKRLEASLLTVASMFSWTIVVDEWWLRAFFGGIGLISICVLLYRISAEAKQVLKFDSESVLHLEPRLDTTSPVKR